MAHLKDNQVILIAPNSAAIKSVHKNYFEYDEAKISNPPFKMVVTYLASNVNGVIEDNYGIAISYEYVIFGTDNALEKAGVVFFLEESLNEKANQEIIEKAQELILFSIQELLPSDDLFNQKVKVSWLSDEKREELEERQNKFLTKWRNSKIQDGFSLYDTSGNDPVVCVNTDFISPDKKDTITEKLKGTGWPDGFSKSRHEVTLRVDQESLENTGDIRKFKISHPGVIKLFIEACYMEKTVRFTATKTTETISQKSSYSIDTLEVEEELADSDTFALSP